MADSENASILRRKIGAQNTDDKSNRMTVQKALRQAAARAAQDAIGLEVTASGCVETQVSVEAVIATLEEMKLVLLLEGPERSLGLAVFDPQIVAGVVEHLTTGRVVPSPADPRAATRTDAMMISDLINQVLAVFDAELAQMPDAPPVAGFHQLLVLEDARAVLMALDEIPYRKFTLGLDLSGGAKSGEICLYFPYDPPRKTDYRTREYAEWQDKWRRQVMEIRAPIEAIIHRVSMPVTELMALEVGSLIPVPLAQVSAVLLEGSDGHCVATGKLGQAAGFRAIRISTEVGSGTVKSNKAETEIAAFAEPPVAGVDPVSPEIADSNDAGQNAADQQPEMAVTPEVSLVQNA